MDVMQFIGVMCAVVLFGLCPMLLVVNRQAKKERQQRIDAMRARAGSLDDPDSFVSRLQRESEQFQRNVRTFIDDYVEPMKLEMLTVDDINSPETYQRVSHFNDLLDHLNRWLDWHTQQFNDKIDEVAQGAIAR